MTPAKQGKPGKGTGASGRNDPPPDRSPDRDHKRVNVDFPDWMVARLDGEAKRLGVSRQSLIKFWIAECLDKLDSA